MNKKSNLGRIMMEMLGVLALVGLLTLGFIFYQKALLADRVNRLMEDARLAGLVVLDGVYNKLTVNEETSLKGQFEQQTPYNFSAYLEGEEWKTFVVLADGVPYDVCREIIDRKPQWAEEIIANKLQNQCLAEMDNIIGFFYNDELTNNMDSCKTDADCGECGECKNHLCSYGFKNQSGECKSCDGDSGVYEEVTIPNVSKEECDKCKNRIWRVTETSTSCSLRLDSNTNVWSNVPPDECAKFPNQYSTADGIYCFYCEGIFNPTTGACSTAECGHHNPWSMYTVIYGLGYEECLSCGGHSDAIPLLDNGGVVRRCFIP